MKQSYNPLRTSEKEILAGWLANRTELSLECISV